MNKDRIRYAGLLLGLLLIIIGFLRHEPAALLMRAIKICLECAGIG